MPLSEKEFALRDAFKIFKNQFGLIDDQSALSGLHSGNSLLYHSHFLWCLKKLGYYDGIDGILSVTSIVKGFEIDPGNYRRAPKGEGFSRDQEGIDDFIGLASMSAIDKSIPFAREILAYGHQNKIRIDSGYPLASRPVWVRLFGWVRLSSVFNSVFPETFINDQGTGFDIRPWFGRFPQFRAHLVYCTGLKPGFFSRLAWAFSVWATARFKDRSGTDPWILSWHLVNAYQESTGQSFLNTLVVKNFYKRFYAEFPEGLSDVFKEYFGPMHPLTRFFPK